jgi:hypothetical protein
MRGRIALFVVLAVVVALVAAYAGWSTNTPRAVADPTATPSDASVGATGHGGSGSGGSGSSGGVTPGSPPKTPRNTPPKVQLPVACSSEPAAKLASYVTQEDEVPVSDEAPTDPAGEPVPDEAPTDPAEEPVPAADPLRLGPVATTPSDDTVLTSISDDRRALTTAFSAMEVQIWNGTECDLTKSMTMTLPLVGEAKREKLKFYAQGYAFAQGATARLTLRHNGRDKLVKNYPSGTDGSFVEILELPGTSGVTHQMSAVIEVHHAPGAKGDAYLNILAIDVGID